MVGVAASGMLVLMLLQVVLVVVVVGASNADAAYLK